MVIQDQLDLWVQKVMSAALVNLDNLDLKDFLDYRVLQETLETKAYLVLRVLQGHQVIEVQRVKMEHQEVLVYLELLDHQEIRGNQAALVNQEAKDLLVCQACLGQKAFLDFQEQWEPLVLKEPKDLQETLEQGVILVYLVTKVL